MTKCKTKDKTCPFLYGIYDRKSEELFKGWVCSLDYTVSENIRNGEPYSLDCKLEVVQYATDKSNSITFIPERED